MKFTTDLHGRLQTINLIGFVNIPIFGYFDRTFLGLGIGLTISGLVFFAAFFYKTKCLSFDWTREKIFNWFFEGYADRAANICFGTMFFVFGLSILIHELG